MGLSSEVRMLFVALINEVLRWPGRKAELIAFLRATADRLEERTS